MGELIVIRKKVGANGDNLPDDVVKIGAALTAVGPDRGGIFAPPLSIGGLAEAIKLFQTFQKLSAKDGRVDPGGTTLKKINEILNPGLVPPAPKPPGGTGVIRPLTTTGLPTSVSSATFTPEPTSFRTELVFNWIGTAGGGTIHYFELDEDVVPNWFGIVIPNGAANFQNIHLFFHPTPSQGGFLDKNYKTKVGWSGLFHYLTDLMSAQFCAAGSNQVLVMPLLTQSAANTCGILPQRWESLISQMLGQIAAQPVTISSVVVSSFSSGITFSAAFRKNAGIGGRLRGIIDFDGIISSFKQHSQALPQSALRFWQTSATKQSLKSQIAQNIFPLPHTRWGGPFQYLSPANSLLAIHGVIPQTMMHFAANLTRAN